jgi:transposase
MLNFSSQLKIFAYLPATDMRKGFAGLSAIIREEFEADPTDGSLFLFINKRRDRMKLLHFSDGGFWLYYRLLEAGTFEPLKAARAKSAQKRPATEKDCRLQLDGTELSMLLSGVSLQQSSHRRKRFAK